MLETVMTQSSTSIEVLIVDDHPMVREGLAGILARHDIRITGVAANGRQAIEMFTAHPPDVMLLDLRLPDQNGLQVIRTLMKSHPAARIVVLSSSQGDASIYEALSAGASGYLLKGIDGVTLSEQLRRVAAGGKCLSPESAEKLTNYIGSKKLGPREIEALSLISQGLSNKEIARLLFVTEDTIKMHVKNILQKLQANDRTQAVVIAMQRGLLDL